MSLMFSSESMEWATPPELFAKLHRRFHFTLDAAANSSNALLPDWYGPDHPDPQRRDALTCDWAPGPVFLNPPYGRMIRAFMAKAHAMAQHVTIVALVPARVETEWFRKYANPHTVTFLEKRLHFSGAKDRAPFPSALIVMSRNGTIRYTCAHCSAQFAPRKSHATYCSTRCRVAAHRAAHAQP